MKVLTPPLSFPLQVFVDEVHQVGHALYLCILLWTERLLPQTEEEKGASSGRGGFGGRTMEGSGNRGVTAVLSAVICSPSQGVCPFTGTCSCLVQIVSSDWSTFTGIVIGHLQAFIQNSDLNGQFEPDTVSYPAVSVNRLLFFFL